MSDIARLLLTHLGLGKSIDAACRAAGIPRDEFDHWWQTEITARNPQLSGNGTTALNSDVEIVRDPFGVPHIFASNDNDLFFGFGWAMAQDRLWQLDYLRRKALGRLAEILGKEAIDRDVIARTVGLNRIAKAELKQVPASTLQLLEAFSRGINLVIASSGEHLPIEFALLDYAPEPWSPLDSIAIWAEFRWYLTGRLPVIALPEVARRHLNNESLYQAFLTPESGDESILPPDSYPTQRNGSEKVGAAIGDPQEGLGSNNWTVAGSRSTTGSPLLATDPHIAFGAVSCWYEAHLCGGSFNTVGMAYAGVPSVVMGRNEDVAWCLTNNICSQRDLYLEQTDTEHPDSFYFDGRWEPASEITETIQVRDGEPLQKTIRFSRNGPIVNELLPKVASEIGPVSLRWLGATFCDELTSMLAGNRARSAAEYRQALRGWIVPTWNFVFADRAGHIGYQAVGRIPLREGWERGFRPGWEPAHQWRDLIPFDGMPALADPASGWIRTANNRNAPEDFPYPLSGTWANGQRAERIRLLLEEQELFAFEDFGRMQQDTLLMRAVAGVPPLLRCLAKTTNARFQQAAELLRQWNCRMDADQVAASIFELFFRHWSQTVAAERFSPDVAPLMANVVGGLALELLSEDKASWFAQADRVAKVLLSFERALQELEDRLGADMSAWQWGNLHTITLRHPLSTRGELSKLLDRGGYPLGGNGFTVCNTGFDQTDNTYEAAAGANYRLIADLGAPSQGLWAVDAAGQSGHPGSAHYCDQLTGWLGGEYHFLPLDRANLLEQDKYTFRPQ